MKTILNYSLSLAFALVVANVPARAAGPDEEYLKIYSLIQQADRLSAGGRSDAARNTYLEAQTGLQQLQISHPNWNDRVVKFRLQYVERKIGAMPQPATATPSPPAIVQQPSVGVAPSPSVRSGADQRDAQIRNLQVAIQQLEGEKNVLTAKLNEALAVQPAAIDPRELTKAQERIRGLEKETELLRVSLDQEQARRARLVDPSVLEELKHALVNAEEKLSEQRETAVVLAREKELLEARLRSTSGRGGTAEPNSQLAVLEKQVQEANAALASSTQELVKLREDKMALERSKTDLEKRLAAVSKSAAEQERIAADRIRRLETERDELQASLRRINERNGNAGDTALAIEAASLRARLAVLEAEKVPYSEEELALFRQPPLTTVKADTTPIQPAINAPSEKIAPLIAEAERSFGAQQFATAERNYQEALAVEENNPATLGNLAATQLEQNKLAAADVTLARAVGIAPDNARILALLGILRFRQDRTEDAFEALSRAAKLDPANAETQNYLGITLGHMGQRAAAEAALRRAIQLSPRHGGAHQNLAVIYINQNPPFKELARFHYEKAIAAGLPRNMELEKLLAE